MGFSLCTVAASLPANDVAAALALDVTEADFDQFGHRWWIARFAGNDWTILNASNPDFVSENGEALVALSKSGRVLGHTVVENLNHNAASFWEDGLLKWSASYELGRDPAFEIEGSPPSLFSTLRENYERAMKFDPKRGEWVASEYGPDECDHLFSAIDHLVEDMTDHAYNGVREASEVEAFWIVKPPKRPGLFSRLLGRR